MIREALLRMMGNYVGLKIYSHNLATVASSSLTLSVCFCHFRPKISIIIIYNVLFLFAMSLPVSLRASRTWYAPGLTKKKKKTQCVNLITGTFLEVEKMSILHQGKYSCHDSAVGDVTPLSRSQRAELKQHSQRKWRRRKSLVWLWSNFYMYVNFEERCDANLL